MKKIVSVLRLDFAMEWGLLGLVALIDALWAEAINFHLILTWRDCNILWVGLGLMLALRFFLPGRAALKGGLIAEYFCLTMMATCVFTVMSYLAFASSGPLADDALLTADRALGFDWLQGFHFLQHHTWLAKSLALAYDSLFSQGLYFCLAMGILARQGIMRELFWLTSSVVIFAMLGALLFPAMGPFFSLGADPHHYFLADMVRLKSGKDLRFALWGLTGVVSFPSIHTSMALTYMYGFRGMGAIGWAVIALNLFMLFSVPYFGGHYLMDMIGGACDFALSLMLVRCFPAWCRGAVLATGAPALSQN